ncbi:hypothetical protein [Mesonia sp. K4-1]|uniref:hypothetical protein n=1 Tax=Mesonia sp. K4-1 TaxID=2602760 RepID=UPI0011CAFF30|nr:hypothetical protein [Mesonia sp. K4-1]TXK78903.1 hypothetical protein FT986_03645 [Mesonia sp. K4-1]
METLVATIILIIIFVISSLILNNIFGASIQGDKEKINNRLKELEYFYRYDKIELPYEEDFNGWGVYIISYKESNQQLVRFEITNKDTNKSLSYSIYAED